MAQLHRRGLLDFGQGYIEHPGAGREGVHAERSWGLDVERRLKLMHEHGHEQVPFVRISFDAFQNDLFQRRRYIRIQLPRCGKAGPVELVFEDIGRVDSRKRFLPGYNLVSSHTIGEDVNAMINGLTCQLFRCHVGRCTGVFPDSSGFFGYGLCKVKVHKPDLAGACDHDIFGLEIQVHEPAFVHVFEANGHVNQDLCNVFRQQRVAPCKQQFKVYPLDVFHQQVRSAVNLAVFVVTDDEPVLVDFGKDFASTKEPAPGNETGA